MWNICDGAIWSIRWEGIKSFENNPLEPKDLLEAATSPGIIHYWGHPKPWQPNSLRQDNGLFYKYWKNLRGKIISGISESKMILPECLFPE